MLFYFYMKKLTLSFFSILQSLTFQKINRALTAVDSQPMFDGGVLINVLGRLQVRIRTPPFHLVFRLELARAFFATRTFQLMSIFFRVSLSLSIPSFFRFGFVSHFVLKIKKNTPKNKQTIPSGSGRPTKTSPTRTRKRSC